MKTEPATYSIDDLGDRVEPDDLLGRRSQLPSAQSASRRNQEGDRVLFYHSACKEPAVVGTAVVSRAGYPDSPASTSAASTTTPRAIRRIRAGTWSTSSWIRNLIEPVTLASLREKAALKGHGAAAKRESAERPAGQEKGIRHDPEAGRRVVRIPRESRVASSNLVAVDRWSTGIRKDILCSSNTRPKWRNWQTRRIQNPVRATSCGFKSHLRYLLSDKDLGKHLPESFFVGRINNAGSSCARLGFPDLLESHRTNFKTSNVHC